MWCSCAVGGYGGGDMVLLSHEQPGIPCSFPLITLPLSVVCVCVCARACVLGDLIDFTPPVHSIQ